MYTDTPKCTPPQFKLKPLQCKLIPQMHTRETITHLPNVNKCTPLLTNQNICPTEFLRIKK